MIISIKIATNLSIEKFLDKALYDRYKVPYFLNYINAKIRLYIKTLFKEKENNVYLVVFMRLVFTFFNHYLFSFQYTSQF
jgi:hypothetical protein